MRTLPKTTVLPLITAPLLLCVLTACTGDPPYEEGYRDGLAEGYETGYAEGSRDGATRTALRYESQWGLAGLGIGLVVGGGLVALFTRRYLRERYCAWSRRKTVARWAGSTRTDFDPDIIERIVQIGTRKQRIESDLAGNGGSHVASLNGPLAGSLGDLNTGVLKLATLLQQLRGIRDDVRVDRRQTAERIDLLESRLKRTGEGLERIDIAETLTVEQQKLDSSDKNAQNIRRCELKLAALQAFLDRLTIDIGNMRTSEEQGAFEHAHSKVGEEIAQLQRTYEETLTGLLDTPADGHGRD